MTLLTFPSGLSGTERQLDDNRGQFVTCHADELRPHPAYVRLHITVPASQLSAIAELGDLAFREPLVITQDHIIIDGYARRELARLQGRPTLACIEYKISEAEALQSLLQRHCRSIGLNDFIRICLALELEPFLRKKAQSNRRTGGQQKASSNLTEADRVDVRSKIAAAAGVSVGNVTKVKQLMKTVHPEVLQALRGGEIRIHRAWKWSKASPEKQREAWRSFRSKKGINKAIRDLISRHKPRGLPTEPDPASLVRRLSALNSSELSSVSVSVIPGASKEIFVTEGLVQSLRPYQESIPTCATETC